MACIYSNSISSISPKLNFASPSNHKPRFLCSLGGVVAEPKTVTAEPLLLNAARGKDAERPPVWLMRQAERYMKAVKELIYKGAPMGELSPHVFAVADVAYRAIINEGKSNSILVSGESGAGKTKTTKMLMQYLAYLGGHKIDEERTVEHKVLEVILMILAANAAIGVITETNAEKALELLKLMYRSSYEHLVGTLPCGKSCIICLVNSCPSDAEEFDEISARQNETDEQVRFLMQQIHDRDLGI